jgi:hypothetical protein
MILDKKSFLKIRGWLETTFFAHNDFGTIIVMRNNFEITIAPKDIEIYTFTQTNREYSKPEIKVQINNIIYTLDEYQFYSIINKFKDSLVCN